MPQPEQDHPTDARFAQAARDLQDEGDTQHRLDRAVQIAVGLLPGCDYAGVSVVHPGSRVDTPASTDPLVTWVDALQYEVRQGPCLDAVWKQETVASPDLRDEQRWPRWAPQVAALGIRSMLCVRLFTTQDTLGALNLLSRQVRAFDEDDEVTAGHLAAHLAVALAEAQHAADLHSGARDRSVLGQAEGILMERFSLSAYRAFDVLAQVAEDRAVPLRQVAAELVRTRATPGGDATATGLTSPPEPWPL